MDDKYKEFICELYAFPIHRAVKRLCGTQGQTGLPHACPRDIARGAFDNGSQRLVI